MKWFPKLKIIEWLIIIGLIVIYFALTLSNLTKLPIFVDEAIYLRWAQIAWHDASWRFISLTDGKQPLYTWLVIPFMKIIKDPLYAGRFTSALCGFGTLLGVMYAGWLTSGKKLAFWAGAITILSPFLFFYNRFGVMEATMIMFGIWIFNISYLLTKTIRLDIALILGMFTGLGLLVKSPVLFFLMLIPSTYLLVVDFRHIFTKKTFQYLMLVLIGWGIAGVIYNVQRLSPWMAVISQKNAFFTVPFTEILNEPKRLLFNITSVWNWHGAYSTWPLLILALSGLVSWLRKDWRNSLLVFGWFFLPLLGTVLIARLFAPRYMVFTTPWLMLLMGYGLVSIKSTKIRLIAFTLVAIMPIYLIGKLIFDPIHYPYVSLDEGYVNGWSAGNGAKQIADWAVMRIKATGKPMTIFTEGTFGTLPHALELYADGRVDGLTITGLWPVLDIPPIHAIESVKTNPETYIILNNSYKKDVPQGLELVASYPKLRDNPMNLYRVLPVK